MDDHCDSAALVLPEMRQIEAAAIEESRPPRELVSEAIGDFLRNRRWRRLVERGQARARELGLTEADLPRLIAEARALVR
jgi:hypothetical protein